MDTFWQGPPTDVLGQVVPIQRFVARTDSAVIALQQATAFPQGCLLTLLLAVRRGFRHDSAWADMREGHLGHDPARTVADQGLKLGVRFTDGSRATTVEHAFPGWAHPSDLPRRPMLVEAGSESSSDDQRFDGVQRLWLWPLPPSEPFELVVEWRGQGVESTSVTLDGTAVVRAAAHAVAFWA